MVSPSITRATNASVTEPDCKDGGAGDSGIGEDGGGIGGAAQPAKTSKEQITTVKIDNLFICRIIVVLKGVTVNTTMCNNQNAQ